MTPAEMKTLRENLGLTQDWLAEQMGVQKRSVQYWEKGFYPVKKDVEALLLHINANFNQIVNNALIVINQSKAAHVNLLRYASDDDLWLFIPEFKPLPATAHASMLFNLLNKVKEAGGNCSIVYMDKVKYLEWLSGRDDSEQMRSLWASEQN